MRQFTELGYKKRVIEGAGIQSAFIRFCSGKRESLWLLGPGECGVAGNGIFRHAFVFAGRIRF